MVVACPVEEEDELLECVKSDSWQVEEDEPLECGRLAAGRWRSRKAAKLRWR